MLHFAVFCIVLQHHKYTCVMKSYKLFRWLLRASALTTVMFIMQACYGTPYKDKDMPAMPDDMEMTDEVLDTEVPVSDTLVQAEMQSAE